VEARVKTLGCTCLVFAYSVLIVLALLAGIFWLASALPGTDSTVRFLDEGVAASVPGAPRSTEREPGIGEDGSSVPPTAVDGRPDPLEGAPTAPKVIRGDANQATLSHGRDYLAMRLPRGTVVDIVGPGGKWLGAKVNDYGPKRSTGDIADIGIIHWREVCGLPDYRGECVVAVTIHGKLQLPATDTE
jgi:hypothetical protein